MTNSNSTSGTSILKEVDKPSRKKNALAHGVYAEDIILPWESHEEFVTLFKDLAEEFRPDGRMEEEVVLDLAHLRWQKRGVRNMWHAAANRNVFVSALVEFGKQSLEEIRGHLRTNANSIRHTIELLHARIVELAEETNKLSGDLIKNSREERDINGKQSREQKEAAKAAMNEKAATLIRNLLAKNEAESKGTPIEATEALVDRPQELENKPTRAEIIEAFARTMESLTSLTKIIDILPGAEMTLGRAYSPEYLEPVIRIEALIDARIDKLLGRLVSLKEYKQFQATHRKPARIPAAQ